MDFSSTDTRVLSTKQPKRKIFFSCKRAQKKSYSQLNSFFFQQEAHETEQKKRRKNSSLKTSYGGCDEEVLVKEEEGALLREPDGERYVVSGERFF